MDDIHYSFPADVIRVVDGDTAICKIDLGFHVSVEHSIRLADIDAPELFRGTPEEREQGALAKSALMNLVAQVQLAGGEWPFLLKTDKDRQSFGRYIGWIWPMEGLDEGGISIPNLNTQMVDLGHATYSD